MGRFFKKFMIVMLVILIAACSTQVRKGKEEKDSNNSSQTVYQFSYKEQDFKIISFLDEVLDYVRIMKENPELDGENIFNEKVIAPFQAISSLNYVTLDNPLIPTSELEQLEKYTNELLVKEEQINQWIEEALVESAKILSSGEETKIYIFPVNPEDWFMVNQLGGMNGFAYFENNILLMIDPTVSEKALKHAVAHEYHHTVNMFFNGEKSVHSILDLVMTEGEAEFFAGILYPEIKPPWIKPLSEEEEAFVLDGLVVNGDSTDLKIYNDFLYGNYSKKLPSWSNYRIGYQIMNSFIENNPKISVLEWTKMDAKEIVKGSKYKDKIIH